MAKKDQSRAFHLYVDDWLSSKKINLMDAHEERGYLRLLCAAWTSPDCGLPDVDVELSVIALLGPQWNKPTKEKEKRLPGVTSGQKLRQCFELKGGRLYNERLLREWEYQQAVKKQRSEVSKVGVARKRELAQGRNQLVNQTVNRNSTYGSTETQPMVKQNATNYVSVSVSSEDLEKEDAPVFDLDAGFREVWNAYPRKGRTMQSDSRDEYVAVMFVLPLEEQLQAQVDILSAIHGKWATSEVWAKGFVMRLKDWIKNRRWNEDPEQAEQAPTLFTEQSSTPYVPDWKV